MPDEHNRRTEPDPVSPPANDEGEALNDGNASQTKSPLISAVEIENFKGIGRPVRIDLRPITLLFGRNSAGKSSVLHALCYAHEILSHRNVDAHKTELGGDQIDLGGFRNFVHAHDLTRKVRLRFELNLRGQTLPDLQGLAAGMPMESFTSMYEDPLGDAKCGWVDLTVRWLDQWNERTAIISSYEVGIDGQIVGHIAAGAFGESHLSANPSHPLLKDEALNEALTATQETSRVNETDGSERHDPRLHRLTVVLPSALPSFQHHLLIRPDDALIDRMEKDNDLGNVLSDFKFRVSTLVVGVGSLLRDELAQLRYLGPLRDLHPRNDGELGPPNSRRWANGSAAWDLLNDNAHSDSKVLNDTSDWLSRKDRLDTGYELRARSDVTLPADDPLVARIHAWKRNRVVADSKHVSQLPASPGDVVKNAAPGMVEDLANTIAEAPVRKDVELVSIRTGLPVRTFDVGVGISQLLPIVVAALDPQRPGITAIEQPELHTHPRLQVELGDLFGQQADDGGILVIETHSEHLLLRIMRRMRQTNDGTLPDGAPEVRPEDVNVLFVEPDGAQTLIREMPLNERGELVEAWPGGFFEEDLREIF